MSGGEREQQLLIKTVQQEEELRRVKRELERLRAITGSPRRPQTAGLRGGAETGSAHQPTPPAAPQVVIKKSFDITLEPPQGNTMPTPVEAHTAVAHEGKVTIFGGTSGPYISSDVWQYSVGGRRWRRPRTEGNAPTGRYGHTAIQHLGRMYVFGGFGPGGVVVNSGGGAGIGHQEGGGGGGSWSRSGLLNSLYALDLRKNTWTAVSTTNTPEPVKSHSAVAYKGRMYVFGGCMPEGRTNVVNALDLETDKWLPTEFLNAQALAAIQGASSHATGGGKNAVAAMSRGDVPAPRSCHSANLFVRGGQGSMIVFGGRLNNSTFCNDVFQYNFENRHWQRLFCGGNIPLPRSDHTACLYKEHLVVFGGCYVNPTTRVKQYLNDCHVLNVVSCTWTRVELIGPQRPLGLFGHTSILYESPEALICVLTIGGWGVLPDEAGSRRHEDDVDMAAPVEDPDHHPAPQSKIKAPSCNVTTTDDVWSFGICVAPPAQQKRRSSPQRRPQTAGVRPGYGQSPRGRPTSSSPRGRGGAADRSQSGERIPWRTQTSMASTAKEFGVLKYEEKTPCLRTDYQIDNIVARLRDTRSRDYKMQELNAKYLHEEEPKKLSEDEQTESVDRLFYQQCEWQAEKQKQLETKWIPRAPQVRVEEENITDLVCRLGIIPEKKEPEAVHSSKQSKDTTEDCVQRLHYFAQEFKKKRNDELGDKYLWGAKSKQIGGEKLTGMIDRLVPPPGPTPAAKMGRIGR